MSHESIARTLLAIVVSPLAVVALAFVLLAIVYGGLAGDVTLLGRTLAFAARTLYPIGLLGTAVGAIAVLPVVAGWLRLPLFVTLATGTALLVYSIRAEGNTTGLAGPLTFCVIAFALTYAVFVRVRGGRG